MGEKGNTLSSAEGASAVSAGGGSGVIDQAEGVTGDVASTAAGVVVGATTDLAQEHVHGRLEGLVHHDKKLDEEEDDEVRGGDATDPGSDRA